MKKIYLLIIILLIPFLLLAQKVDRFQLITQAEYFINTDPGEGKGTPIQVQQGFNVELNIDNIPFNNNDKIFVRVKNENGAWSAPYCRKLGSNFIEGAKVFKVTYPNPNFRKLIEVKANIGNKKLNGLIASAVSDPIEGDNLKPGDTLLVQFKGANGVWGPQYEVILAKPDLQIPKPMNLKAENIGSNKPQVKLSWIDNSLSENQFSIERNLLSSSKKNADVPQTDWIEIGKVNKNTSEYIDEATEPNKEYEWRVRALGVKDWMNSDYSNIVDLKVVGVEDNFIATNNIKIFPNPFTNLTEIQYFASKDGYVSLVLSDLNGRVVANLIDRYVNGGWNTLIVNGSGLTAGTYFLRLESMGKAALMKIVKAD